MPQRKPGTGKLAHRVADVMKACRTEWQSVREVADATGYAKPDYVRNLLLVMRDQGIVCERWRDGVRRGGCSGRMKEYRVAEAWRNV